MTIGKFFQWLFMEKSARDTLEKRRRVKSGQQSDGAVTPAKPRGVVKSDNRDQLKQSALDMLRERRGEFDALDQDVQDRVAKATEKALSGGKKKDR
jgi:hypothetical protein